MAREALSITEASKELKESANKYKNAVEELETRANASKSLFDYADAIACLDSIIIYSEEIGIGKEKLGSWYLKISDLFEDNGNYLMSLNYSSKALVIYEKDGNDSLLAATYNNIAYAYNGLGNYRTALQFNEKVLKIVKRLFDSSNSEIARGYGNISMTYINLPEFDSALKYMQKAVLIFTASDDSSHKDEDLASSYNVLSVIYEGLGESLTALEFAEKYLTICEKINRKINQIIIQPNYHNIGSINYSLKNYAKAIEYQEKDIQSREIIFGKSNPILANAYSNIGLTYLASKDFKMALKYENKSIDILEKVFDSNNAKLAAPYLNIGEVYQALGENGKAFDYYKKSISIFEQNSNNINPNMAKAYLDFGNGFLFLKKKDEAIINLKKSIDIYRNILPRYKDQYQDALDCLSVALFGKGSELYLEKKYKEAITNLVNVNYPSLVPYAKDYLGGCYAALKDYSKAIMSFQEVLNLDTSNKVDIQIYSNIGTMYAKNGQLKEAKISFEKFESQKVDSGIANKNWALYYALKKDKEKSIAYLQKAIEYGYSNWERINTDDSFETLRNDERYKSLMDKIRK